MSTTARAELGQTEARSLEPSPFFPHGLQEPRYLSHRLMIPGVHISRKLDWKRRSWDSVQTLEMERERPKLTLCHRATCFQWPGDAQMSSIHAWLIPRWALIPFIQQCDGTWSQAVRKAPPDGEAAVTVQNLLLSEFNIPSGRRGRGRSTRRRKENPIGRNSTEVTNLG